MCISTDAAWKENARSLAGIAVKEGKINLSWTRKDMCSLHLQSEMKAILLAADLARTENWRKICIASDSLMADRYEFNLLLRSRAGV